MTRAASGSAHRAPAEWTVFAAVTLLSLVWALLFRGTPSLIADTARDLLFARDCSELGHCLTIGAKTSFSGWYQGGAWLQLVAAVEILGGGVRALQGTVIALEVLSCGLWYVFLSRYFAGFMPVLASLFWAAALCVIGDHTLLWNHSGMALPAVLASAGLLVFAAERSLPALWVAVFWTGMGIGFHVDCATLLPVELVAAVLAARRPFLGELSVLVAFLLGLLPTSLDAVRANLMFVLGSGSAIPVLAGALVLLVVPRFARARFWRAGRGARIAWLAAGAIAPSLLGLGWLALHGHAMSIRYVYAALPAALALLALGVDSACRRATLRLGRWAWALLAGVFAAGGIWIPRRPDPALWSSTDARAVAAKLSAAGYSYDAARWHVQGPHAWDLVTAMASYLPPPTQRALPVDKPDLLVLRPVPGGARGGSVLHPAGRPPLWVRGIEPWLDILRGRVCILPARADRSTEAHCTRLGKHMEKVAYFRFRSRKYPRMYETSLPEPYIVRFVIPVHPRGSDAERDIQVLGGSQRCAWKIVRVDGIAYRGRLPTRRIVLERGSGGSVTISRRYAPDCSFQRQHFTRPGIAETHPDEAPLRAALEGR